MRVTRRDFLKYLVTQGTLLALNQTPAQASNPYDFLYTERKVHSVFTPMIQISQSIMKENAENRKFAEKYQTKVLAELKKRGWSGDVMAIPLETIAGISEEAGVARNHLNYVRKAENHLYESIDGLVKHPVKWTPLNEYKGDGFSRRGFLVNNYSIIKQIKVSRGDEVFYRGTRFTDRGGYSFFRETEVHFNMIT